MVSRRYRVLLWAGPLIFLSWLSLAFLDPDPGGNILETLALGYFLGSLFAHATLAAAWAAFGPGWLIWRLPLSLVWVSLLPVAIAINVKVNGGPAEAAVVVGACLIGQWLILQPPLWGLALGLKLRLRETDEAERGFDPRQWQFGIRQLIIITAIVSVMFGVGRLIVPNIVGVGSGEASIFIFLGIAAVVITLPLLLAALMRRMALPGVMLVLVLIALASAVELPLLKSFHRGPGPEMMIFVAINAFTAATILAIALVVRCNGLYLGRDRSGAMAGES